MTNDEIQAMRDTLDRLSSEALDQYMSRISEIEKSNGNLVDVHNATVDFLLSLAEAKERIGFQGHIEASRDYLRKQTLQFLPKAQFGKAGDRLAAIAVAYTQNFRPADAGAGRMNAAIRYAARIDAGDTDSQMNSELAGTAEWETNAPSKADDAIIKSIRRLKKKLSQTEYYRFNEDTLHFEVARPDMDLFDGLPQKKGRPRKKT